MRVRKQKRRSDFIKSHHLMANKIANMVTPSNANGIFEKLRSHRRGRDGGDPRSSFMSQSPLMIDTPDSTRQMMEAQSRFTKQTRSEYANQSGIGLPNLVAPTADGRASAQQPEEQVAGGSGSGNAAGNTVYVDDANWHVTLAGIIGSGKLTQAQMQKASIANVKKLVYVGRNDFATDMGSDSNGTAAENEELYYMFQRMMVEGFIRGVDISNYIDNRHGLNISIRQNHYSKNPDGTAVHIPTSKGSNINFRSGWWREHSELERYTVFMHEVGHALLARPELSSAYTDDIMGPGPTTIAKRLATSASVYNAILDDHFRDAKNHSYIDVGTSSGNPTTFDASWFPQLAGGGGGGGSPPPPPPGDGGGGGDDGGDGGGGDEPPAEPPPPPPPVVLTETWSNSNSTSYPDHLKVGLGGVESTLEGSGNAPTPVSLGGGSTTPIAGSLSGDVLNMTKGFASTMADLSQPQQEADGGLLLQSG